MIRTSLTCLLLAGLLLLSHCVLADKVELQVHGAPDALETNIRNHIGEIDQSELDHRRLLQRHLRSAVEEASEALGYYGTTFTTRNADGVVHVDVKPGRPVLWAAPSISIDSDAKRIKAVRKVLQNDPFDPGKHINQGDYDSYKRRLLLVVEEYGYLDAHYRESRLLINLDTRRAKAVLHLVTGERYRFGRVTFSGSEVRETLLHRLAQFQPGDAYRKAKVTNFYRSLQQSGYFRDIKLNTKRRSNHTVDIAVALTDDSQHHFAVGAGYGTDTGVRGRLRWEWPLINSYGHSFTAETSISQPIQELFANYRIPLREPLKKSFNINWRTEHKNIEDTRSTINSLGAIISDQLTDSRLLDWGVNLENEIYRQGSQTNRSVTYAIPNATFTSLVVPPSIDPMRGRKLWVSLSASDTWLGADSGFVRGLLGYKQLIGLGGTNLLIVHAEVGAIATSNILDIPSSQRFFTGGDQTVRGYDYESLGPRDADGQLIGGKFLNVASIEYSRRVAAHWRLAVFHDRGRAYNESGAPWHSSVGVGLRWLSPVGQIRFDVAFPLDKNADGFRIHIFMGPPL